MLPYPTLDIRPDFDTAPVYGVLTPQERSGLSPAADTAFFPQEQIDSTFGFRFVFLTREECRAFKAFFLSRGGQLAPFYLPSWQNDLPAISGTAGSNLLTVSAEDYAAAHLGSGTHGDDYGRQIFVWQPNETLFVSPVVGASEATPGETVLDLAGFLPFEVDAATAIIGFLYLAKFDEEELNFDHLTSAVATVDVKFRSCRQWSTEVLTLAIARLDHTPALGFTAAEITIAEPVPRDTRVAKAPGFEAWVNTDGIRFKASALEYSISIPDGSGAFSDGIVGFVDTQHLSMTFDPDGVEAFAYQLNDTTFRIVTGGGDTVNVDITGLDPLLCSNIDVDGSIASGDQTNFCYYRKANDSGLYVRIGGGFGTETKIANLPVRPLKLKRIYADGLTFKLEYVDAHFRTVTLTSAAYPAA